MDDIHAPSVASGPTSNGAATGDQERPSLQELIAKKEDLEATLSALGSTLDSHRVDMKTPLMTPDGFPRSDIDVAQIRTVRASIIRLKNDHKRLMTELEKAVHEHFAAGKQADTSAISSTASVASGRERASPVSVALHTATVEPPFARVNSVVSNSPADEAGLRAGDKIIAFGGANWTNHERLSEVARVVQQNENVGIPVNILRQASDDAISQVLQLRLTPRRNWGGRGLLGCHLLPI